MEKNSDSRTHRDNNGRYRRQDPSDANHTISIGEAVSIIVASTFGLPYLAIVGAGIYLWRRNAV